MLLVNSTLYLIILFSVLKAIDTAGVRHIKSSAKYSELLEKEIGKTKFAGILRVIYIFMLLCYSVLEEYYRDSQFPIFLSDFVKCIMSPVSI